MPHHSRKLLATLAATLLAVTLLVTPAVIGPVAAAPAATATAAERAAAPRFRVATLNLVEGESERGVRHDIMTAIRGYGATVLAMQERRTTKKMLLRILPDHWALAMQVGANGMDENPIAWNTRVWQVKQTWLRTLAVRTYRRDNGRQAHAQYGTVAVLKHRRTGHVIRAISFHMPPSVQNRSTGGPNWAHPDRVETFWRMSKQLRTLAAGTPAGDQFIALCDCNVTESRDTTSQLLKGKVSRPLGLQSQYAAAGYRKGWRIDYVLAQKGRGFSIRTWWELGRLATDHPGVVAELVGR
jgi:hypothetical protein